MIENYGCKMIRSSEVLRECTKQWNNLAIAELRTMDLRS